MSLDMRTVLEVINDPLIPDVQKCKGTILWVLHNVEGMSVEVTAHYADGDMEERAIPLRVLSQLKKELLGAIGVEE